MIAVFTFGGGNGFQTQYRRRPPTTDQADTPASPLVALLPILILFFFAMISILPSLLSGPLNSDPEYGFERSTKLDTGRKTWNWGVQYYVDRGQWEGSSIWQSVPEERRHQTDAAAFSSKVRSFERSIESNYVRKLQNEVGLVIFRKG